MGWELNKGRLSAEVFATGQVARIMGCSAKTVSCGVAMRYERLLLVAGWARENYA